MNCRNVPSVPGFPKALFLNPEVAVFSYFAPNPKAPIPVLINDPTRYPNLDPKYTMTGVKNPAELFPAVSAMVRVTLR